MRTIVTFVDGSQMTVSPGESPEDGGAWTVEGRFLRVSWADGRETLSPLAAVMRIEYTPAELDAEARDALEAALRPKRRA